MQKKILLTLFATIFTFIFFMSLSSAALAAPAESASIGGTAVVLNATNASNNLVNMTNCTFYARSASTANSSYSQIAFQANTSQNPNAINTTFNSLTLQDSNDYSFNVTCRNITSATNAVNGNILIDNTVPNAPTSLLPPNNDENQSNVGVISFSATVTDANTTACNLVYARNSQSIASADTDYTSASGTYSTTSCTATRTFGKADKGNWYYLIQASDGTNRTNSSVQLLRITSTSGGAPIAPPATPSQSRGIQGFFDAIRNFFSRLFGR